MPIMKVHDSAGTHYIPHPHRVVSIHDWMVPHPVTTKLVQGCRMTLWNETYIDIPDQSALKVKRSIQENTEQDIGFLKMEFASHKIPKGLYFVNADHVLELKVQVFESSTNVELILDIGGAHEQNHPRRIQIQGDHLVVANQLRRVVKRLDQDEALCCNAPPEPPAEEENDET